MTYDIQDIKQAALGSTIAVLFFFMIRAGNPVSINPTRGFIIGIIWLWINSVPLINKRRESGFHAIGNIIVAVVVSTTFALIFEMITVAQIQSFEYFGSAAWLAVMLAVPSAQFFDKMNILNPYEKWFHRRMR